jgi:predicted deacylase
MDLREMVEAEVDLVEEVEVDLAEEVEEVDLAAEEEEVDVAGAVVEVAADQITIIVVIDFQMIIKESLITLVHQVEEEADRNAFDLTTNIILLLFLVCFFLFHF